MFPTKFNLRNLHLSQFHPKNPVRQALASSSSKLCCYTCHFGGIGQKYAATLAAPQGVFVPAEA